MRTSMLLWLPSLALFVVLFGLSACSVSPLPDCEDEESIIRRGGDWVCTAGLPTCGDNQALRASGGRWTCAPVTDLTTVAGRVSDVESALDALGPRLGATESAVAALDPRVAGLQSQLAAVEATVTGTIVVGAGGDFASLDAALASLTNKRVRSLMVVIRAGTYTHQSQVIISHPDGDQISIVGDPQNEPGQIILSFQGSSGIGLEGPAGTLAYLGNLTIRGAPACRVRSSAIGLRVVNGARVRVGSLRIENMGQYGVLVENAELDVIDLPPPQRSLVVRCSADTGVVVENNARARLRRTDVQDNGGHGISVSMADLRMVDVSAEHNGDVGLRIAGSRVVGESGAGFNDNATEGVFVRDASNVQLHTMPMLRNIGAGLRVFASRVHVSRPHIASNAGQGVIAERQSDVVLHREGPATNDVVVEQNCAGCVATTDRQLWAAEGSRILVRDVPVSANAGGQQSQPATITMDDGRVLVE